jgi:hypothetical protein
MGWQCTDSQCERARRLRFGTQGRTDPRGSGCRRTGRSYGRAGSRDARADRASGETHIHPPGHAGEGAARGPSGHLRASARRTMAPLSLSPDQQWRARSRNPRCAGCKCLCWRLLMFIPMPWQQQPFIPAIDIDVPAFMHMPFLPQQLAAEAGLTAMTTRAAVASRSFFKAVLLRSARSTRPRVAAAAGPTLPRLLRFPKQSLPEQHRT